MYMSPYQNSRSQFIRYQQPMMQPMFRPQPAFMGPRQYVLPPRQMPPPQPLQPLVSTSQPIGSLSGAGGQLGQPASGAPGQAHKSLEEVLAEKGFQLPKKPTGPVTQDHMMMGPDPVTGRMRGGGSSERPYYKAIDDFYAQNPEALEIAKQYNADPGSFGSVVQHGLARIPTQIGGGVPNALAGQLGTSIAQPAQAQPMQAEPARLSQQGMNQMQQMQAMMQQMMQMIAALSNRGGFGGGFGGYQPPIQQTLFGGIGSIPMGRGLYF